MGQGPGSLAYDRPVVRRAPNLGSPALDHRRIVRPSVPNGQPATWSQSPQRLGEGAGHGSHASPHRICERFFPPPWNLAEIITGQNICRQMQPDAGSYWISGLSGGEWIPMPARMVRHDLTKATGYLSGWIYWELISNDNDRSVLNAPTVAYRTCLTPF